MFPLNTAGRIGVSVGLLLAGVVALRLAEAVVVPLMVALLLATVLGPAAVWLHQKTKIQWFAACILVILGLVLANVLIFFVFSVSVFRTVNQISEEKKILEIYGRLRNNLERIAGPLDEEVLPKNPESVRQIPVFQYLRESTPAILQSVSLYTANWSWQVVLILFTTFFVLLEGHMLARRVAAIFGPSPEVQAKATEVLMEMAKQVQNYLVWRTIINLGLAVVMGAIFQMFGLGQAWTWAILLAILNYIPYFGPVLASIPPFLDAFISTENPAVPIVIMILFWVVISAEGWLIVPLLMGRSMDLNATTVMLACLFWPLVWGPTGLFLAMPIMAGIKAILNHVPEWRVWADLMSSADDDDGPPAPGVLSIVPAPMDPPSGDRSDAI